MTEHRVEYFYRDRTAEGTVEGYQCPCGWFTLGTDRHARRDAKRHERVANR